MSEPEPFLLGDMPSGPPPRRPWWQGTPLLIGLAVAAVVGVAALWFALANQGSDPIPQQAAAPTSKQPTALEQVAYTCSLEDDAIADQGHTLAITTDGEENNSPYDYGDLMCIARETGMPTFVRRQLETTRALDGMQKADWDNYSAFWNYHPDNGMNLTITDKP